MSDGRRLQDKVAIVTGSSGGIGRALAVSLAAQGTKLVVCADLQSKARTGPSDFGGSAETHELINQTQGEGKAIFVQCNVSKEETVAAVVQEAVNKAGRLDMSVWEPRFRRTLLTLQRVQHNQQRGRRCTGH